MDVLDLMQAALDRLINTVQILRRNIALQKEQLYRMENRTIALVVSRTSGKL